MIFSSVLIKVTKHLIYKYGKSEINYNCFKQLRYRAQCQIDKAKKNFFKGKLENKNYDSKSLWSTLKELSLPSKKSNTSACTNIGLKIDNNICFDKLNVAEAFNKFYTSVASKLVEKLPLPFHKFGKKFCHCILCC